ENVARLTGPGESGEPRPAGADAPRRNGHAEGHRALGQLLDVDAASRQLMAEVLVVILKRLEMPAVVAGNVLGIELEPHHRLPGCRSARKGGGIAGININNVARRFGCWIGRKERNGFGDG